MKFLARLTIILGLVAAFAAAGLVAGPSMMNGGSSVCSTHCVAVGAHGLSTAIAPTSQTLRLLLGAVALGFIGLLLALLGLRPVYRNRRLGDNYPIALYRLNMSYSGYLG